MTTILHVSCSPRGKAAESYRLAREVIDRLRRAYPEAVVVDRVIGGGELPPIDDDYALSQQSTEDVSSAGTMAQSEVLVQELERARCEAACASPLPRRGQSCRGGDAPA